MPQYRAPLRKKKAPRRVRRGAFDSNTNLAAQGVNGRMGGIWNSRRMGRFAGTFGG